MGEVRGEQKNVKAAGSGFESPAAGTPAPPPVAISGEAGFPPITAVQDVTDRVRIFHASQANHARNQPAGGRLPEGITNPGAAPFSGAATPPPSRGVVPFASARPGPI